MRGQLPFIASLAVFSLWPKLPPELKYTYISHGDKEYMACLWLTCGGNW